MKSSSRLFGTGLETDIVPKIATLRKLEVSGSNLVVIMMRYPHVLIRNRNRFDDIAKEVVKLGINPLKTTFVYVLQMMLRTCKSTWERKIEVFRNCGWSKDDFQLAFKKSPQCMGISEEKIISAMDFFVNDMGWEPAAIANVPSVLNYNLKKRTIPRFLVVRVLMLKGLIGKSVFFSNVLTRDDKFFLDKFVTKYVRDVPQLMDVFNGKVGLAELGLESKKESGGNSCSTSASHI